MDGLLVNVITEDDHKLTFLRSMAGFELFTLLESATSYAGAMVVLDQHLKRPTRVLYARHQLLTCAQKPGEPMNDFTMRLKLLVQACECTDVNVAQHHEVLLRDALVAGVSFDGFLRI